MGLLEFTRNLVSYSPPPVEVSISSDRAVAETSHRSSRYYNAGRNTAQAPFNPTLEAQHQVIQRDLVMLRAHSRELIQNNPIAKRYIQLCSTNLIGGNGIVYESTLTGNGGKPKRDWDDLLEDAFLVWGKAATPDGLSWVEFQDKVIRTVASDGECFIHILQGNQFRKGMQLELIDADSCDWSFNEPADAYGNRTVMGIRLDAFNRKLGYWMWKAGTTDASAHPSDWSAKPTRVLVSSENILHVYDEDRIKGLRGIPWLTQVMIPVQMLGHLYAAELESAIKDAERCAVITGPAPEPDADGNFPEAEVDDAGNVLPPLTIQRANELQYQFGGDHSHYIGLDDGQKMDFQPSTHPNANIHVFAKSIMELIASGTGVSYHELSCNVSEANYSSARVALLDSRARWQQLQTWFIRAVVTPIFEAWLRSAVLSGEVNIPVNTWEKLNYPKFWAPSFQWIDPLNDTQASVFAIKSGLSSHQVELGARGLNWRRVFEQVAEEQAYAKELGITLDLSKAGNSPATVEGTLPPTEKGPTPVKPGGAPNGTA